MLAHDRRERDKDTASGILTTRASNGKSALVSIDGSPSRDGVCPAGVSLSSARSVSGSRLRTTRQEPAQAQENGSARRPFACSPDPLILPVISVQYERGVYLPNENIWLDPWDAKPFAFVSHAHSDHIAPHDEIIVSERTARLMQARLPGERHEHVLPFGVSRPWFAASTITLLPAGHIFGSAQFFLESGRRLAALHRRFQIASRPFRRSDGMEAGRHSDHGNDLRPAAISPAADRIGRATDRRLLPRGAGGRGDARAARLLVRQSAGDSLLARGGRSPADAARLGLSDDAHLRAVRPGFLRIRALQPEGGRRQGADLSAERESLAHAGKNSRTNASR